MAYDPIPDPDGNGVLVDVGSAEGRRGLILAMLSESAGHHDTVVESVECALTTMLLIWLTDLVVSAYGDTDLEARLACAAFASDVLAEGQVHTWRLVALGEAAMLCNDLRAGGDVPADVAVIWESRTVEGERGQG